MLGEFMGEGIPLLQVGNVYWSRLQKSNMEICISNLKAYPLYLETPLLGIFSIKIKAFKCINMYRMFMLA